MEGGGSGGLGRNTWIKQPRLVDGDLRESGSTEPRSINIGGKATVWMGKGDRLLIETPGGGGWGAPGGRGSSNERVNSQSVWAARGSLADRAAAQAGF